MDDNTKCKPGSAFARFKNVQCIVVPKHLTYDLAWECQKCLVQNWKSQYNQGVTWSDNLYHLTMLMRRMFISISVLYVSQNCMWDCFFGLSKVETRYSCLDSTSSVHLENSYTKKTHKHETWDKQAKLIYILNVQNI